VSALRDRLIPPAFALLVVAVAGDLLILAHGQAPARVWSELLAGTWGNGYGLGQVLYKTSTLICTGLSVAIALRAGLLNIGAEGQLAAGGFAAAVAGMLLPGSTPGALAALLAIAAAAGAGAVVGLVPGVLKARAGAHEVLTTIMTNFVVLALLSWALDLVRVPETLHTPRVAAGTFPRLSAVLPALHGSAASGFLGVALLLLALTGFWLARTRGGFELGAVGLQPAAAEAAGVPVGGTWIRALAIAGALAGTGGAGFVLGYKGYSEVGFGAGAGYLGIAVAFLGRASPAGVAAAALFFATLSQGGLAIHALVPEQMVDVLQGVAVLALAAAIPEVRRVLARAGRPG
jgi:simple sugar transport system permease protein